MITHHCVNKEGEHFIIFQNSSGAYLCPVCGSPEFEVAPYDENGLASFDLCTCGFQFGFDDSPLASQEALHGVIANWDRWRIIVINKYASSKAKLEELLLNLDNIGIELAFDLIPTKKYKNT